MLTSSRLRLVVPAALLSLLAAITWYPLLFMFSTSFKTRQQFFDDYWWFSWPLDVDNYVQVWPKVSVAILNSLQYSGGTLVLVLLLSLLGGYAFGRFKFRGKNVLFLAIL